MKKFNLSRFIFLISGGVTDELLFEINSVYECGTTAYFPISTERYIIERADIINQSAKKNNPNDQYEDISLTFESLKDNCLKSYGNYNIYESNQNTTDYFNKNTMFTFERFHWLVGEVHIILSTGSYEKILNDTVVPKLEVRSIISYASLKYKSTVQESRKANFEYDKIRIKSEKLEQDENKRQLIFDSIKKITTNKNKGKIMNEF